VRRWIGPIALDAAGKAELARQVRRAARGGVAAFVQARRSGEILQATALAHRRG